jgi:hypothetical protein
MLARRWYFPPPVQHQENIMKVKPLIFTMGMLLAASTWANGTNAADQTTAPAEAASAATAEAAPDQLQQMNANVDKMHDLIGQMQGTTDMAERQKLMMEYMMTQRENMMLGRDMMMAGGGMPGMGMMNMHGMAGPGMGMGGPAMGMQMRHGQGGCMNKNCRHAGDDDDTDHCMSSMRGMKGGMPGMGMMGMRGMRPGMGMGMQDDAMSDRIDSLEKRLDALQDMMKMMMTQ